MFLDRSDTSDGCAAPIPGEVSGEDESGAMMSDDHAPISPSESNETDDTTYFMPWIKVITRYILYTYLLYLYIYADSILHFHYNFRLLYK